MDSERFKGLLTISPEHEKTYRIIYYVALCALAAVLVGMFFYYQNGLGLWLDEMFEVDYCLTSSSILEIIAIDPYTPPLFNIIAWLWYRLVPYGEIWLHIPSLCFCLVSLFLVAASAKRLAGKRAGFVAALLFCLNAKVFSECMFTFRAYALLLVLSCLFVYLYIRRMQTPVERIGWGLTIAMAFNVLALGYTHYFGVLFACAFFLVDLYLLARGRLNGARIKVFAVYAFALVCYIPWLKVAFATLAKAKGNALVHSWQTAAAGGSRNMHAFMFWLAGGVSEVHFLFTLSTIIVIVATVWRLFNHSYDWRKELPTIALVFVVYAVLGGMWIYCSFINAQSMLWVARYFMPLIPCIVIVATFGLVFVFGHVPVPDVLRLVGAMIVAFSLVSSCQLSIQNDLDINSSTRFYKDLTEWLEEQPDIEEDSTMVLAVVNTTDRGRQLDAWKNYYFDRKETRDFNVTIVDGLDVQAKADPENLLNYKTIYVTCQHFDPDIPEEYLPILNMYFVCGETENPGGGTTYIYSRI